MQILRKCFKLLYWIYDLGQKQFEVKFLPQNNGSLKNRISQIKREGHGNR